MDATALTVGAALLRMACATLGSEEGEQVEHQGNDGSVA